jgi:type I restriction enzyme M protein
LPKYLIFELNYGTLYLLSNEQLLNFYIQIMTSNYKELYEKLWAAAEQLRANGSFKLNEISEPILGLIFLKFADVRFKHEQSEIVEDRATSGSKRRQAPITPEHYKSRGVLYLPDEARYSYLMNLPEGTNIGKAINDAIKDIESANTDLAGVLPQSYTNLSKNVEENNRILISLLKNFNQIPDDIEGDAFGGIYEYFLGEFARAEGAKGGEFFTAQPIVKLLVEVIEPYHGQIYDPACGSGGMFVQSANFVKAHSNYNTKVMNEVAIYGQEKGSSNIRTAKMNLAIHGLSGKISEVNSYYEDPYKSVGRFDYVLANPPFNVKGKDKNKQTVIDPDRLKGDPRYYLGLPLTGKGDISNANYLWMQMFASALNDKGRAGFVMANAATDAGNAEKKIRQKLVDSGIVDIIITVGSNMFMNAALSCTLWFFDKGKTDTDRKDKVLFINAQDIYTEIDRAHFTWTDDQIQKIATIVKQYRKEKDQGEYYDIPGRCKAVSISEIKNNNYTLNPMQYVGKKEVIEEKVSFDLELQLYNSFLIENEKENRKKNIEITNTLNHFYENLNWQNIRFTSIEMIEDFLLLIFKEWFVNYKFPDRENYKMVESKDKDQEIPKGWEIKKISNKITIKKGKNITKGTVNKGIIPVVAGGLGPAYYHNKSNTKGPVVTVSASGANSGFTRLYYQDVWASDCSYIDSSVTEHVFFYYLFLKNKQDEIYDLQRGSAQPHVYPKDLMNMDILDPGDAIIEKFNNFAEPFFKLAGHYANESFNFKKYRIDNGTSNKNKLS